MYDHAWSKKLDHIDLISGLLKTLQDMAFEVLKSGEMEEIRMKSGILIFFKGDFVTAGIISTKSTHYLRESLQKFVINFENKFEGELKAEVENLTIFKEAQLMIDEIFYIIPFME